MDYLLKIYYTDNKNLDLILNKDELAKFLDAMANNTAYKDETRNSGIGVPLYNVKYYNFFEYTAEMKKAAEERLKEREEAAKEAIKEEEKSK